MNVNVFFLTPRPPFRLDLTVWTLRRRPDNAVDRWDGQTYRRVLPLSGGAVEVAVKQVGLFGPGDHEAQHASRVSAQSPTGTAMFGARVGDQVCWYSTNGPAVAAVWRLIYQPESAGDHHL